VIVGFVDIVKNHCLNFLFIIRKLKRQSVKFENLQLLMHKVSILNSWWDHKEATSSWK